MVTCPGCAAKVFIPGDMVPLSVVECKKCGHSIMMPMQLRHFELRQKLGSGGMGTVYRAWDNLLDRYVAIKLIKPELLTEPGIKERFLEEAKACAGLNHTNIIHIYSCDELEGQWYIIMENADKGSLDSVIEKINRLDELQVLDIGIKIASALDLALKHDLLHCDIKPGNILFNQEREPKLVDFGLSHKAGLPPETMDHTSGTPFYVAPEKIKRETETFLSDMYSLAATLYHAITGYVPFDGPSVESVIQGHVSTPLTSPNLVLPSISQPTSDALEKALAKNPAERYLSYDEFIMALESARSMLLHSQSHTS